MFFIGTAIQNAPICTRTRRCIFLDYIDENAIQNNFQRAPPFLDGSVYKFPAIAVEMEPSSLTAACQLNTRIQRPRNHIFYQQGHENGTESVRKACTERSVRTGLYARICTYRSVNAGLYVRVRTYQTAVRTSASLYTCTEQWLGKSQYIKPGIGRFSWI